MSELVTIPSLDDIVREPARAAHLPSHVRGELIARCAAALAALSSPLVSDSPLKLGQTEDIRLLTVAEAAAKLAVAPEWLYRRGKRLGLAVKLGDGTLRFSSTALERYIRENTAGIAIRRRARTTPTTSCNE